MNIIVSHEMDRFHFEVIHESRKTVNEIIYEPYNLIVDENNLVIFVP